MQVIFVHFNNAKFAENRLKTSTDGQAETCHKTICTEVYNTMNYFFKNADSHY